MAVGITATVSAADFGVLFALTGLTVGSVYDVKRNGTLIMSFKADNTTRDRTDMLAPFGEQLVYTVAPHGQPTAAAAAPVVLPWAAATPDVPLWDADSAGSWPILRSIGSPDKYVKVPVTAYSAEFGFRAHTQPILGSQFVSVASQPMLAKRFTFVVLTPSNTERRRLINLLRAGTLHLRSPCVDGLQDQAFVPLQVSESVPWSKHPLLRAWQIEAQAVAVPSGWGISEASALQRTWADVKALGTWAQVKAVGTWAQIKTKPGADTSMADNPLLDDGHLW